MAKKRTISIEVEVDAKGAVKAVRGLEGSVVKLSREAENAANTFRDVNGKLRDAKGRFVGAGKAADSAAPKITSFGSAFDVAIGGLMVAAAVKAANAMGRLVRAGGDLVGVSTEIGETADKFSVVFGKSEKSVQGFLDSFGPMAGVTENAGKAALSTAAAIAQGLGETEAQSAETAISIARLAGDLKSFNNIPFEQAFGALTSALTGEREQLKSLGIVINEADVQTRALADNSTKAAATMALAYERAGVAVGNLEDTQDSAANAIDSSRVIIENLRNEFAEQLLPAITAVAVEVRDFLKDPALREDARKLGMAVGEALESAIEVIKSTIVFLREYGGEIKEAAKVVGVLTIAVMAYQRAAHLAKIQQQGLNLAMKLNPVGLLVAAITAGSLALTDFYRKTLKVIESTRDWDTALRKTRNAVSDLGDVTREEALKSLRVRRSVIGEELKVLRERLDVESETLKQKERFGAFALAEQRAVSNTAERIRELTGELLVNSAEVEALTEKAKDAADALTKAGQADGGTAAEGPEPSLRERVDLVKVETAAVLEQLDAKVKLRIQDIEAHRERIEALKEEGKLKEAALLEEQLAQNQRRAFAQEVLAFHSQEITSAADAANAVVDSIKRIILARQAEAIANAFAKEGNKGLLGLITGAAALVGMKLLFSQIPAFAMGTRNAPGGVSLVGEMGPELVNLPRGSQVIPSPQTARMMQTAPMEVVIHGKIKGEDIHFAKERAARRLGTTGRA